VADGRHIAVDLPDQHPGLAESAEGDGPLTVEVERRLVTALRVVPFDPVENLVDVDGAGSGTAL
jgi:hypothetical protein